PPLEIERKFLLSAPPDFNHPALSQAVPIEIEQTYLHSPDPSVEVRVRRRAQAGQSAYFYTRKQRLPSGACVENEALIRPAEYLHLLAERDPDRTTIHKTRFCFAWEGRYFELDVIQREDA